MKKLVDLRFVIGAFFFIVGWILLLYFFLNSSQIANGVVNAWCGLVFILFGCFMIFLSYRNNEEE